MKRLARSLSDLAGLRAALWVRESTAGQFDAFGPDAQRQQYERALRRWELEDTGVAWSVAHSGWRIARSPAWHEMLGQAGATFDVLVVGYASRFARSLEAHVDARRAFHAAGASILFADEEVLTSDENAWERWAREAVEAEAYSRKLSRRVREGLAAKRRVLGEPGGRSPFGFVREGRPPVLAPVPERIAVVRRVFEHSAAGLTDAEVAAAVELPLFTVRGILTNPIYVGRLRDGTPARVGASIEPQLWNASARRRAKRATNTGQPAHRSRDYALRGVLVCDACERRLIGDTGYYRHHETCEAFAAATQGLRRRPFGRSVSVPASDYDAVTERILARMALRSDIIAGASALARADEGVVDHVALARIERDRTAAMERYRRDRDAVALERAMATLDRDEEAARVEAPTMSAEEVRAYLADLPRLWREAPETRGLLVGALFERVRAMGTERLAFDWAPEAIALGIADGMPAQATISVGSGRGERARGRTYRLSFHGRTQVGRTARSA
jgi:DNA invertase Pin-like site-specific DNA recombinase